jgi:hypothetical protein
MSHLDPSTSVAGSMEKPFIFVSYSRRDRDLVYTEVDRLERAGYRLWCDRWDIPTGQKWLDEINNAIRDCDCFLIFMSEEAATSRWVGHEIDQALLFRKAVIVIYLARLTLSEELDGKIGHIQGLEFYSLIKSEFENKINDVLSQCVGKPQPSPMKPGPSIVDLDSDLFSPWPSPPIGVLPKVVFFGLLVSCAAFGLFGVTGFVTPLLITDPSDPLSNRLGGILMGILFSGIAAGLAAAAFAVYWLYLRRHDG